MSRSMARGLSTNMEKCGCRRGGHPEHSATTTAIGHAVDETAAVLVVSDKVRFYSAQPVTGNFEQTHMHTVPTT